MRRALRVLAAAAAVATLTQCASPAPRPEPTTKAPEDVVIHRADVEPWLGEWTGPINQAGVPPYTVQMNLDHNGRTVVGTVEYPDLDCSGMLSDAALDGDVLTVTEHITEDGACLTPVDLELTLRPSEIEYRFEAGGGGEGELRRPAGSEV